MLSNEFIGEILFHIISCFFYQLIPQTYFTGNLSNQNSYFLGSTSVSQFRFIFSLTGAIQREKSSPVRAPFNDSSDP